MRTLMDFVPLVATLVVTVVALRSANWFLLGRHKELAGEKKFTRQLIMLALSLLGIVAVALSLPLVESTRNQLIAFFLALVLLHDEQLVERAVSQSLESGQASKQHGRSPR